MQIILFGLLILVIGNVNAQQKEIRIFEGSAPGSENWTWKAGISDKNSIGLTTVFNVVDPTLTVFLPDPAIANGSAVIVCPGGGFHFLAINHEGIDVAKILLEKGITVFLLKYRLHRIHHENPYDEMVSTQDMRTWDAEAEPVIPLAIDDGRAAIAYVRKHTASFNVAPKKIGIMGFSAGGMVAASTAFNYSADNRPDFVVPVYPDMPASRQSALMPDAPPLFMVCSTDDEFGFSQHLIGLYNKWYFSKRSVELHLFAKGGHGFGVGNQDNTTNNWLELFVNWLYSEEMIKSAK